jgi:hypothetical protein
MMLICFPFLHSTSGLVLSAHEQDAIRAIPHEGIAGERPKILLTCFLAAQYL